MERGRISPDVINDTESPTRYVLEHVSVVGGARDPRPIVLSPRIARMHRSSRAEGGRFRLCRRRMHPSGCSPFSRSPSPVFERGAAWRIAEAQTKLVERKVVERAKGFLMQQKGITEEEAFRMLRKLAMDRNAKLLDVAQQVVDVAKMLS
jgi:response regulator NasT